MHWSSETPCNAVEHMIRGPQKVIMYNEPYVDLISKKHPSLMGSVMVKGWAEVARDLELAFAHAESLRRAVTMEMILFLQRRGYVSRGDLLFLQHDSYI